MKGKKKDAQIYCPVVKKGIPSSDCITGKCMYLVHGECIRQETPEHIEFVVLNEAQDPHVEPYAKDAGCVQATGASVQDKPVVDGDQEPVVMCAWCRRIKEDGKWIEAEVFDCKITHGICPECYDEQSPMIKRLKERNKQC